MNMNEFLDEHIALGTISRVQAHMIRSYNEGKIITDAQKRAIPEICRKIAIIVPEELREYDEK